MKKIIIIFFVFLSFSLKSQTFEELKQTEVLVFENKNYFNSWLIYVNSYFKELYYIRYDSSITTDSNIVVVLYDDKYFTWSPKEKRFHFFDTEAKNIYNFKSFTKIEARRKNYL